MKKKKVLIVGSFLEKSTSGHVGGQMFASTSLVKSKLSKKIKWLKVDTTATTNKNRNFIIKLVKASKRMSLFCYYLVFYRPSYSLIFSSSGWSFREKGTMVLISKLFGVSSIIAPRSGHFLDDIDNSEKAKSFAKKVFSKANYIICQGSFWKNYFIDTFKLPVDKFIIIPNWIDNSNSKSSISKVNGSIQILFMGWVERNKGIFDIIKVAENLKDESIIWNIAGNGKDFDEIKNQIYNKQLSGKINLLNWVTGKDKIDLFNESNILLIASYKEGFPNIILEGMKNMVPIIASNIGGIPDSIVDGENGYLIEPGDVDSITKKIKTLINSESLREQFANKSLDLLKSRHSIENAVSSFEEILLR